MRNLTVEDSGTYQCGVDIERWTDTYRPVKLKVKADSCCGNSMSETLYVGGIVNISCSFSESTRSDPMFLYKSVDTAVCTYKTSITESRRWINEGNSLLYDDRAKQMLTVTIRNVTVQDFGTYWCGAESDWESDHGYKVYIAQIYLRVTGEWIPY
ncbi:hypothetical protein P4O66_012052 [Electrophorus voltai]|uniref:Ig-like domain-containing protein n=1 Tax=Electrophorus voltai TaxID=2609070 RepID=A0AAD8YRA5_9TELE|nr:hypothetical protein P4O66_012052 [Electrophorus voltai]